jgi:hypothetical protein
MGTCEEAPRFDKAERHLGVSHQSAVLAERPGRLTGAL